MDLGTFFASIAALCLAAGMIFLLTRSDTQQRVRHDDPVRRGDIQRRK